MDEILQAERYYLALLTLMIAPLVLLYWFLIHTFIAFWRRIGHRRTYWILLPILMMPAVSLFVMRMAFLAVDFGTNYYFIALAIASYFSARLITRHRLKEFTTR